jgi:NAD(P)-dependent dehydrogenase (short-subunit alcohol dehydrogenase family)
VRFLPINKKIVLITGATGALGRVTTKRFLERGAEVVSVYRTDGNQSALREHVGDLSLSLDQVKADVTSETEVLAAIHSVVEKHGRIDVLLNLVGAYVGGQDIANTRGEDWDRLMDTNLKSVFLCSRAVLPYMIEQNYGKIVSVAARPAVEKRWRVRSGAYAVSKAGVLILTETVAEEVKNYEINVNCVLPSTIDTPANRRAMPSADFSRWVSPEQIADVILFLASDASKAISGAALPVYGKA